MNKRKLVLLSLILPVLVSGSVQANPWKNTLKKAGYAGAAALAIYTGYQAAKAYGLFGQSEQPAQAPAAPVLNQPGVKTAQQLLEENQIKLIDARVAQRATLKAAQAEEQAKKALAEKLRQEEIDNAALANQLGSVQNILLQKSKANDLLQKAVAEKDSEIEQLATLNTNLLGQLSKTQAATQPAALPVTIATSALPGEPEPQPIFDLKNEYIKVLRTSAINVGSMINASKKAFDSIAPFFQQHYANDQVLVNWGVTYNQIRTCQNVMEEFNQMLRENDNDFSNPEVLKQAEVALRLLYSACQSIKSALPMYRTKIADKASPNWNEWFKGKDAQVLEEFDSFKLSFEQRLQQLNPIKDGSLTQ